MKPKTKLQKQIATLSIKLPPITQTQGKWAIENIYRPTGYLRKYKHTNKIWCLECGNSYQTGSILCATIGGSDCPHCGKELEVKVSNKRVAKAKWYYSIITTSGGFQVIRHFIVDKTCAYGYPAKFSINECVQNWISPKGEVVHMSRATTMSMYYDSWIYSSPIEIRSSARVLQKYDIHASFIYPRKSIISELKRNGFKGGLHGISPCTLFQSLLTSSKIETLIKAKQYSLLKRFINQYTYSKIEKYWPAIKICIRNNYIVKDASMWCDYIDMLVTSGRDIHNARFVCPNDLKLEHDKYSDKIRKAHDREELEKKKAKAIENEAGYREFIEGFLDLCISDGEILVEPLKTVSEFISEGDELHHCVFTNGYYNEKDSLILSAKINGKRLETIEFSLSGMRVAQSRGICNNNTEHHDRIVKLVEANKERIGRCKSRMDNIELSKAM